MKNFEYATPRDARQAVTFLGGDWSSTQIMGGGTDLMDELKERLVEPNRVVHLPAAAMTYVKQTPQSIGIGAMTTLATLESNPLIKQHLPGLAEAAASIGTPQIRNAGTIGGNLCQRPRCWYYRQAEFPCIKKGG